MLPVLAYDGWRIDTILLDRGEGLCEWVELRHGNPVEYVSDRADLLQLLQRHGLRYADFREIEVDDGCE